MHAIAKQLVLILVLVLPLPLWAQSTSGWYGGVGLNSTRLQPNDQSIKTTFNLAPTAKIEANSYNLAFFGGYRFDQFLALQADVIANGSVRSTDLGQTAKLFDVSMMVISATMGTALTENITLYGKLGGTSWTLTPPETSNIPPSSGFGPSIGAGLDINLYGQGNRRLRAEWSHHRFDDVLIKSASSFTLGAVFYF